MSTVPLSVQDKVVMKEPAVGVEDSHLPGGRRHHVGMTVTNCTTEQVSVNIVTSPCYSDLYKYS